MVPPIVKIIGILGRAGLEIASRIDDSRIDKQFVKGAIKITDSLGDIVDPTHSDIPDYRDIFGD